MKPKVLFIRRDPASSLHDMDITTSPNWARYRVLRGHVLHHGQCHCHLHVPYIHRDHHGCRGPHGRDPGTLTPSGQLYIQHRTRTMPLCSRRHDHHVPVIGWIPFGSHQNSVKRDLASCPPCPPCPPCSPWPPCPPCSPWPPCPEPPFKNFSSPPSQPEKPCSWPLVSSGASSASFSMSSLTKWQMSLTKWRRKKLLQPDRQLEHPISRFRRQLPSLQQRVMGSDIAELRHLANKKVQTKSEMKHQNTETNQYANPSLCS